MIVKIKLNPYTELLLDNNSKKQRISNRLVIVDYINKNDTLLKPEPDGGTTVNPSEQVRICSDISLIRETGMADVRIFQDSLETSQQTLVKGDRYLYESADTKFWSDLNEYFKSEYKGFKGEYELIFQYETSSFILVPELDTLTDEDKSKLFRNYIQSCMINLKIILNLPGMSFTDKQLILRERYGASFTNNIIIGNAPLFVITPNDIFTEKRSMLMQVLDKIINSQTKDAIAIPKNVNEVLNTISSVIIDDRYKYRVGNFKTEKWIFLPAGILLSLGIVDLSAFILTIIDSVKEI